MCEHARSAITFSPQESRRRANSTAPSDAIASLHHPVFLSLRELFFVLKQEIRADPKEKFTPSYIDHISKVLGSAVVDEKEWSGFTNLNANKYTRNLMAHHPEFTVLLLCWSPKQRSPIHDHAGSNCWVKVLSGELTERRFAPISNPSDGSGRVEIKQISETVAKVGDICYIDDSQGLHEMANENPDHPTITMHVYAPPYYNCSAFSLEGVRRPVSMLTANAPCASCVSNDVACLSSPRKSVQLVNFCLLVERGAPIETILEHAKDLEFTEAEIARLSQFNENRAQFLCVVETVKWSVGIITWLPGHTLVVPEANSWIRVLHGELEEKDGLTVSVSEGVHKLQGAGSLLRCRPGSYAVSLHIGAARGREFQDASGRRVPIVHCESSLSSGELPTPSFLPELVDALGKAFAGGTHPDQLLAVSEVLEQAEILGDDVAILRQVTSHVSSKVKLYQNSTFSIVVNDWDPAGKSVVHDHGKSTGWIRVVEGRMLDLTYGADDNKATEATLAIKHAARLAQGSVSFCGPHSIHAIHNASTAAPAMTLHIYSPPCSECNWHNTGQFLAADTTSVSTFCPTVFRLQAQTPCCEPKE
jgi:cysteine dioxygenase